MDRRHGALSISKYLGTEPLHEVARYSARGGSAADNVAFTGAPRKHPYDNDKLILICDPFSTQTMFYEFRLQDVAHVEELPSLVTEGGEGLPMVRLWVKKGALGLRYEPFIVADTIRDLTLRGGR
jgi:hypothetical protein